MCEMYTWQKGKHIHKNKPIFLSERMLYKDYYRKSSVEKNVSSHEYQRAGLQNELIGGKP
jgi:hypothetical protein